ncbi:MAG TPA: hypothetical protein VMB02_00320 [Candidatus Aquilonibacter sp.]|nr:hypothetical protein [Candidatus Aquilonibacter sp.]
MRPGGFHLSHFPAMIAFALLVSLALAGIGKHTAAQRLKYAVWSLLLFLAIGVGLAWLMYPLSH